MEQKTYKERLKNAKLHDRIMTPHEASLLIKDKMVVAVSGFTPSGYPKDVPIALAERVKKDNEQLKVTLYSGASLGPEVDQLWTEANIIERRLAYQTTDALRRAINDGSVNYLDMHLSHFPQYLNYGMIAKPDIAIVEATSIDEEGNIVPTLAIGTTPSFVQHADKVIVELNISKPLALEEMIDIYQLPNPPERKPIPLTHPGQKIGTPKIKCGLDKIAAIVITEGKDQTRPLSGADETSKQISENIIAFLNEEVKAGRLTNSLLPLQSGVGNIANAVLYGLIDSDFENLTCYTEVLQDAMLDLLKSGKLTNISTTAISLSPDEIIKFEKEIDQYKDKIILRPQEITNNPEVIRRLGVIAMNTAIEIDIYGNVNSTHIAGSRMMNGIGGSGDFARNGSISIFSTPSCAKGGAISSVVPFVSHVDHTEHDVMVVVTEQGYADLRGLTPKERAVKIINNCAHPDYRDQLMDYLQRACNQSANHTPHILPEALSWHSKFLKTGTMQP
ncbi:MAG: acetyl-CoA hydrolase/transferase family protein [Anaerovoracaceae bacterium]